jgi:hypothetical protein
VKTTQKIVTSKKKYEKPRLRIIEMASEEVLAIGCKLADGGFDVGATPCIANFCTEVGS